MRTLHVSLNVRLIGKLLLAQTASVRSLTGVSAQMPLQLVPLVERLRAVSALVLPLPNRRLLVADTVRRGQMHIEQPLRLVLLLAVLALEAPNVRVRHEMAAQLCARYERLLTHVAHEPLVAGMPAHVVVEGRPYGEPAIADRTVVRPSRRIPVLDDVVRAEVLVRVEALVAYLTAVRAHVQVYVLVDFEVASGSEAFAAERADVYGRVVVLLKVSDHRSGSDISVVALRAFERLEYERILSVFVYYVLQVCFAELESLRT